LAAENINVFRVRMLCRENPGLIATAGLRIKIWTLLLLGSSNHVDLKKEIVHPIETCLEQQVLDADVHRTRADVEEFRSTSWRQEIKSILQSFCLKYNIQYKQGMNEVSCNKIYSLITPKSVTFAGPCTVYLYSSSTEWFSFTLFTVQSLHVPISGKILLR
jgi:hypothetical protein